MRKITHLQEQHVIPPTTAHAAINTLSVQLVRINPIIAEAQSVLQERKISEEKLKHVYHLLSEAMTAVDSFLGRRDGAQVHTLTGHDGNRR